RPPADRGDRGTPHPAADRPSVGRWPMTAQVVLLSLDWLRGKDPRRSLGHASILARLRAIEGIATTSLEFAVNSPEFRRERVLASVLAAAPHERTYVAIGAYVWNEPEVQWLLPALRRSGFRGP